MRLRYVHRFKDRHGRVRHYLRRPGARLVLLPGAHGSPEFMAAYQAAIAAPIVAALSRRQPAMGSIDALAVAWYASAGFRQLGGTTQAVYRRIVEALRSAHGDRLVVDVEPKHIRKLVADRAETPAAANHVLRMFRLLMDLAVQEGWRETNPARDVKRLKEKGEGAATWTEAEIATYEARHPPGSRARLALALLLYTGQRRSDVVRMGRQHVRDGAIQVRQIKTGARLLLPIHAALHDELDHLPPDRLTFLLTDQGTSFTPGGFYNRFVAWVAEAGLPAGLSPHGLRKATARRLAEAGCTAHQIAAITGHKTLAEVERYTRAADQEGMARIAMGRIVAQGSATPTRRLARTSPQDAENIGEIIEVASRTGSGSGS